jgi:hypothetical protein
MTSWYENSSIGDIRVLTSESGYINTQLALEYLDPLILHTNAWKDQRMKVLLMDQHSSHISDEFTVKATDANIHPFTFPGHLTHVLQPLDVGVFPAL